MTDTESGPLKCPQCLKIYPEYSSKCSDDGSELEPASSDADPLIGTLFAEKYDILSLLGEGGMSKVYKARHRFMKRVVAVKLLHESATKDTMAKARFQQEAEAASALNHQNVVTVHDFGFTPSGQAFFVMDCLEGKTLEQLLEESHRPLALAQAIEIFTQGCDGLDHAHRKGIIHRDIKPSNLVIIKQEDGSDLVKIVDFGIAKVLTPPTDGEKQRQLTQAGEVFGTPAYMSPEQCSGTHLDGRSDLYSFGCMMYEALSGEPPLVGETFINTVVKHINERPKSFAESAPQAKIPPHIEAVVMKCLEKDPKDRYSSALELKQALFDAALASGLKGLRFGAVPDPIHPISAATVKSKHMSLSVQTVTRQWRLNFTMVLVTALLALVALGSYVFMYPGPDGDSGSLFSKLIWQHTLSEADDLMRQKKYEDAISGLQKASDIAKNFGDGGGRLESTLNKLVEAYSLAHRYAEQEAVNKQLAHLQVIRVHQEYDTFMSLLQKWEQPSTSETMKEERALQASAFAERILLCSDKLSIHSKEQQELLLKKAIKVYDSMENRDWKASVRFRNRLAAAYHLQQRFSDEHALLQEASALCTEKPSSPDGWRVKIQTLLRLGQLDRNMAMSTPELDHARQELELAHNWTCANLSSDIELMKEALNSLVNMDRLYHTKEYDAKAEALDKEAKSLEARDDANEEKSEKSEALSKPENK